MVEEYHACENCVHAGRKCRDRPKYIYCDRYPQKPPYSPFSKDNLWDCCDYNEKEKEGWTSRW